MSEVVPCRFFARGTCRYGNTCRFSHGAPVGGFGSPMGQQNQGFQKTGSIIGASHFNSPQQQQQPTQQAAGLSTRDQKFVDNMYLVEKNLHQDMQEWESGNIWTFSSYGAPSLGRRCLPGFDDISPEEIRYESVLSGGVFPPPNLRLPERLEQMKFYRHKYSQPSMENKNIIMDLLWEKQQATSAQPKTGVQQFGSIFGGTSAVSPATSPSIFGGSSPASPASPSMFGGAASPAPATSPSVFGGPSIFGGTSATTATNSFQVPGAFQATTTGSPFQSPPANVFGGAGAMGTSPSPALNTFSFAPSGQGQNQAQTQPSMNTGSSNFLFSVPQAQTQQQQQPPTFPSTVGAFTQFTPAPTAPAFGQAQPNSGFAPASAQPQPQPAAFPSTTPFGNAQQQQQPTQTPFGGASSAFQPQQQGSFGITQNPAEDVFDFDTINYSRMEDLTPEEIRAFEAKSFDFFPLKLPPKQLCHP